MVGPQSIGNSLVGVGRGQKDLLAPSAFGKEKNRSERSGTYYNNDLSKTEGFIESKYHQDSVRSKQFRNDVFLIFDLKGKKNKPAQKLNLKYFSPLSCLIISFTRSLFHSFSIEHTTLPLLASLSTD